LLGPGVLPRGPSPPHAVSNSPSAMMITIFGFGFNMITSSKHKLKKVGFNRAITGGVTELKCDTEILRADKYMGLYAT